MDAVVEEGQRGMNDALVVPADLQEDINRLVLVSEFVKLAAQARNDLRAETIPRLPNGMKLTARHPETGESLGTVTMSDPEPEVFVVDEAVFEAWVREQNPADLVTVRGFGDPAEIAAVLAEHAPHLLTETRVVPDSLRERALKAAALHTVPGTTRITPDAKMTVTPKQVATELVRTALIGSTNLAIEAVR